MEYKETVKINETKIEKNLMILLIKIVLKGCE